MGIVSSKVYPYPQFVRYAVPYSLQSPSATLRLITLVRRVFIVVVRPVVQQRREGRKHRRFGTDIRQSTITDRSGRKSATTYLDIEILLEPLKLVLLRLVRLYELFQGVLDLWDRVVHMEIRGLVAVGQRGSSRGI
jgi:hypothetical protein